jgi:hypothetical protein
VEVGDEVDVAGNIEEVDAGGRVVEPVDAGFPAATAPPHPSRVISINVITITRRCRIRHLLTSRRPSRALDQPRAFTVQTL